MSKPIKIYFEVEEDADVGGIKESLVNGIKPIDAIEASEVEEPQQRLTGLEVAAAIGAVIVIADSAGKLIDTTTEVVDKLTNLVRSIKGLKDAIVETPEGPKRLEELTQSDIAGLS